MKYNFERTSFMIIRKLGQILGLFSSVAIIFSVFLSYVDLDVIGVSIFSMSLLTALELKNLIRDLIC